MEKQMITIQLGEKLDFPEMKKIFCLSSPKDIFVTIEIQYEKEIRKDVENADLLYTDTRKAKGDLDIKDKQQAKENIIFSDERSMQLHAKMNG